MEKVKKVEKNKEEISILDELHKGATMGMDAIEFVITKTADEDLKEELKYQYDNYEEIAKKIKKAYKNFSDKEPQKTNVMNQAMTYYGIEFNTKKDCTTSKLAELLVQGTNMGVIEGRRLLNQNKTTDDHINELIEEFVDMQEEAIENLKNFL